MSEVIKCTSRMLFEYISDALDGLLDIWESPAYTFEVWDITKHHREQLNKLKPGDKLCFRLVFNPDTSVKTEHETRVEYERYVSLAECPWDDVSSSDEWFEDGTTNLYFSPLYRVEIVEKANDER